MLEQGGWFGFGRVAVVEVLNMYRLKIFVEALLKYTVLWKYSIR
jgi:hypothetical protein